ELANRGLAVFGPSQRAAEIEGSKVFAKQFMERHGIPTASAEIVHDADAARDAAARFGFPVVLKADGLAAGKGVLVVQDAAEREQGLQALCEERQFGASADRVLVEPSCRARKCRSWPCATASTCCRWPPPATTSASATATPAPIPGEW